jgi:hypothetical protein
VDGGQVLGQCTRIGADGEVVCFIKEPKKSDESQRWEGVEVTV